jgi:hypothetical protein
MLLQDFIQAVKDWAREILTGILGERIQELIAQWARGRKRNELPRRRPLRARKTKKVSKPKGFDSRD